MKNRNKVEAELFSTIITRYVRYRNKDFNKLYTYAKKMNIYDKVKDIFGVIYE